MDTTERRSVRDMVKAIQREVRDTDVTAVRAADLANQLAALLGNCNDAIRQADLDYAVVLLQCLDANEAANRARIRAETSPEYQAKREARDLKELVIEMKRSLTAQVKAATEEMRALGGTR